MTEDYVETELKRRLHEIDLALEADDEFRRLLEVELGRLEAEERHDRDAEDSSGGSDLADSGGRGGRQ